MSHIRVQTTTTLRLTKNITTDYAAETNNVSCRKNQESCKKNFEDEANNKQLDKIKDDTQRSNLN